MDHPPCQSRAVKVRRNTLFLLVQALRSSNLDIQGHRGARGLFPENTVIGFIEALRLGVHTIEMDLVVSQDLQVVVSHEAWMNPLICSGPGGFPVEAGSGEKYNLFKMPYSAIRQFDCGSRGNPEFPQQARLWAYKPLLTEVIIGVDEFTTQHGMRKAHFNLEIKTEGEDGLFNPAPFDFVRLVDEVIKTHRLQKRVSIQSFDLRILQEMKKLDKDLMMGLLIETPGELKSHLEALGFLPDVYSPEFNLVTPALVEKVQGLDMRLIPWTVNHADDMRRLIAYGVDGIITDYPDVALHL